MDLSTKETELSATLKCYGSGSGVLSFVYCSYYSQTKGHAISEKVTKSDVEQFLKRSGDSYKNYRIIEDTNGELALMLNITRVDVNTLKVPSYDSEIKIMKYQREAMNSFGLFIECEGYEVKNISIKASIKYFLDNEVRL